MIFLYIVYVFCVWTCLGQSENTSLCSLCYCTNQTLDCSHREMTYIKEEYWREILENQITVVNFSYDPITKIGRVPYDLNVTHYDLSHCNIEFIEDYSLRNMMELESLNLSYNKLTASDINIRTFLGRVKPEPMLFTKLYELDLSYNVIHSLYQDVFSFMPNIRKFSLSGNPLVIIDQVTMGAITSLSKLRALKLSNCQLEKLPEGFLRRLILIETLDLSGNWFLQIPSVLGEAKRLNSLNLSKNPIQEIEDGNALSKLKQLENLQLSNMEQLKIINDNTLGGMEALSELNLSHNPRLSFVSPKALYWIEDDLERCPELIKASSYLQNYNICEDIKLYLNNNNITNIDSQFLKSWDKLQFLDVGHNPFLCDCMSNWEINYLVPLMQTLGENDATSMVCKGPEEYVGFTLTYMYEEKKELVCKDTHEDLTEVVRGRIVLGIMIGVFITLPLVTLLAVLWKKGVLKKWRMNLEGQHENENAVHEIFLDTKLKGGSEKPIK